MFIPVIPALGRLREEDSEFEASLDYIVRLLINQSISIIILKDYNL
jgi:hypothetical protein